MHFYFKKFKKNVISWTKVIISAVYANDFLFRPYLHYISRNFFLLATLSSIVNLTSERYCSSDYWDGIKILQQAILAASTFLFTFFWSWRVICNPFLHILHLWTSHISTGTKCKKIRMNSSDVLRVKMFIFLFQISIIKGWFTFSKNWIHTADKFTQTSIVDAQKSIYYISSLIRIMMMFFFEIA